MAPVSAALNCKIEDVLVQKPHLAHSKGAASIVAGTPTAVVGIRKEGGSDQSGI